MPVTRVEVWKKNGLFAGSLNLGNSRVASYQEVNCYYIEEKSLEDSELEKIKYELFGDEIIDRILVGGNEDLVVNDSWIAVEVGYLFGVTDNSAKVVEEGLSLLYPERKWKASSFKLYLFKRCEVEEIQTGVFRYLGNRLINRISFKRCCDLDFVNRFENIKKISTDENISLSEGAQIRRVSLDVSDQELIEISRSRCLALNLEEMHTIKNFYQGLKVSKQRILDGLPIGPTDVELEIIAQTWSEHCKHKIFNASIDYTESSDVKLKLGNRKVDGLFKEYIKGATQKVRSIMKDDFTVSLFHDNAGIVSFDKFINIAVKVETHNGPSGLDPYGGALTGILGVNRDILGTGIGAKPIANMDVFCVGELDTPEHELPKELIHPKEILRGIHKGVMDGGNKSGIPTVNGAVNFERDYCGKPLVYCGTIGVVPKKNKNGIKGHSKIVKCGMRVVMVGGAIGADGIHGATFSSLELNQESPSSAVQIGDPFTQKKVLDFILEARDLCLYSTLTDNGAGGLSSSIGEMATYTGGAVIDVSKCPVKYSGLTPYQLVISESQERMSIAVSPEHLNEFLALAKSREVLATDIGEFNNSGYFEVRSCGETVAKIPLAFLHDGVPKMKLEASWCGPNKRESWFLDQSSERRKENFTGDYNKALLLVMSDLNVASKERIIRMYDHEVQGATVTKPFSGQGGNGVNSGSVIWMYPHGGEKDGAIAVSCGLSPTLSKSDPYLMAKYAVDEAVRNVIAIGGDPDYIALLDNFCWPDPVETVENPDGPYRAAQLVRSCIGLCEASVGYMAPLISGKDSMKNNFKSSDGRKISVLPTLLITAVSKTSTNSLVESSFKNVGDNIYIVSSESPSYLKDGILDRYYDFSASKYEAENFSVEKNLRLYRKINSAIKEKLISSVQDVSDGGALSAIVESAIGGDLGVSILLPDSSNPLLELFGERSGAFIISVSKINSGKFETKLGASAVKLGEVCVGNNITVVCAEKQLVNLSLDELKKTWIKEEWW